MIDLQVQLCAIPAISPSNGGEGEARKADFLLKWIKDLGFESIDLVKAPDLDAPSGYRPNILAVAKGRDSSRTLWIMTHMDVVPPGELSLWRGNPFQAWIEHGRIYGRGVEDNQQDMVASLFALKAFREEGLLPRYDTGIALVSDEETGNLKGIDYVLKTTNAFRRQDLIIVPDTGNAQGTNIEVAEKSILWLKVKTLGTQAHGSTPDRGVNSFRAASHLITRLDSLYRKHGDKNPLFDPPVSTFEPTKKDLNVPNINTIPGEDVFYLDCRILPEIKVEDVIASIRSMADDIEREFQVSIQLEEIQNAPAAPPTSADAPVVVALQRAVHEVYGVEARPVGIGGGTVASFFRSFNYPAACWSRTEETAHQPNEYCIIDNMLGDAKVFTHVLLQDAGAAGAPASGSSR
jgi:succinyl-diaminopimelate desuccinylase